jgi:hypothetical protein
VIGAAVYGVELIPENSRQLLSGRAALLAAVLSNGEFSKSNMSSSVSASWPSGAGDLLWSRGNGVNGTMKRFSISASTEV